jgi:hypothetical protein
VSIFSAGAAVGAATTGTTVTWNLGSALQGELWNILPVICQQHSQQAVFDALSGACDEASARPLLEYAVNLMFSNHTIPAAPVMVSRVSDFIRRFSGLQVSAAEGDDMGKNEDEEVGDASSEMKTDSEAANTTAAAAGADGTAAGNDTDSATKAASSPLTLSEIADPQDFKLMLHLVSGMQGADIDRNLPRMISCYAEDAEGLKTVFSRITKARPPPMTKADLLSALHRCE